ncbi:hypothetical protein LUZ60_016702 [Juncus effusus]|nr:hypothetical protein LUZ60_016702 [Juncus effusus]
MELKHHTFQQDWSKLTPDLIHLISTKFTEISDLVRFRSVCKNFHAFAFLQNSVNRLPWLLKTLYPEPDSLFHFYSSSFESHKFHIPQMICSKKSLVRSSCDGYLIAYDSEISSPFLFNPITRRKISLPPLNVRWCNAIYIGKEEIGIIGSVSNDVNKSKILAFLTLGDDCWRTVELEGLYKSYGHLYDDKKCYVYRHDGCIDVRDTSTSDLVLQIKPKFVSARPKICYSYGGGSYLVALDQEIFQVYRVNDDSLPVEQCYFDIHRLESVENGEFKWVRVRDIGDKMLFADSVRVFSLKASDFEGYKGNSIYFVKFENVFSEWNCVLCRYDIKDGRAERLPYLVEYGNTWFMPKLVD